MRDRIIEAYRRFGGSYDHRINVYGSAATQRRSVAGESALGVSLSGSSQAVGLSGSNVITSPAATGRGDSAAIPPPIDVPPALTSAVVSIPAKMWTALTMSVVVIVLVISIVILFIDMGNTFFNRAMILIPPPPILTPDEKKRVAAEIQSAVVTAMSLLAEVVPQVTGILPLMDRLNELDFIDLWSRGFALIEIARDVFNKSCWVGLGCSIAAYLVTWVTFLHSTMRHVRAARRGGLRSWKVLPDGSPFRTATDGASSDDGQGGDDASSILGQPEAALIFADKYIGLQVMHLALQFLIVMVLAVLVTAVLTSADRLVSVFPVLGSILLAIAVSLSGTVAMFVFERIVVGRWLVTGLTIERVIPYFRWTIFAIILSFLSGIANTIIRWLSTILAVTLFFSRLDLPLFPRWWLSLDTGYVSYYSMVLVHEEYTNPILQSLVAVWLTDAYLRRKVAEARLAWLVEQLRGTSAGQQLPRRKHVWLETWPNSAFQAPPVATQPSVSYASPLDNCVRLPHLRTLSLVRLRVLSRNPLDPAVPIAAPVWLSVGTDTFSSLERRRRLCLRRPPNFSGGDWKRLPWTIMPPAGYPPTLLLLTLVVSPLFLPFAWTTRRRPPK